MKGLQKGIKFWKKQWFYKRRGSEKQLNFGKAKEKKTDLNMNIFHVSTLSVVASSSLSFVVMLLSLL